jgi:hypothetical protein
LALLLALGLRRELGIRRERGSGIPGEEWFQCSAAVGFVREGVAKLADRGIEAGLKIDEGVFGPEMLLQFCSGDKLALPLGEQHQYTQRFFLETDARPVLAHFACCQVHNEGTKLERWRAGNLLHFAILRGTIGGCGILAQNWYASGHLRDDANPCFICGLRLKI